MIIKSIYCFILLLILLSFISFQKTYSIGEVVRNYIPHQKHKQFTPLFGGIIFILPPIFFFNNYHELIFILGHYILGILDDVIKIINSTGESISGRYLYVSTVILAFYIVFIMNIASKCMFSRVFYIFILIPGIVHSCNVLDGFNGGLSINTIIMLSLSLYYSILPMSNYIYYLLLTFIVFTIFNVPGFIFMGGGSYTIGAIICCLFLKSNMYSILFLAIIPIISSVSVIINRILLKLINKRFIEFSPIHHSLLLSNYSELTINILYTIFTFISCLCYVYHKYIFYIFIQYIPLYVLKYIPTF